MKHLKFNHFSKYDIHGIIFGKMFAFYYFCRNYIL